MNDATYSFPGDYGLANVLSLYLEPKVDYVGAIVKHPLDRTVEIRVVSNSPGDDIMRACDDIRSDLEVMWMDVVKKL